MGIIFAGRGPAGSGTALIGCPCIARFALYMGESSIPSTMTLNHSKTLYQSRFARQTLPGQRNVLKTSQKMSLKIGCLQ